MIRASSVSWPLFTRRRRTCDGSDGHKAFVGKQNIVFESPATSVETHATTNHNSTVINVSQKKIGEFVGRHGPHLLNGTRDAVPVKTQRCHTCENQGMSGL